MGSSCDGCCSPEHPNGTASTMDVETVSKNTDRKRTAPTHRPSETDQSKQAGSADDVDHDDNEDASRSKVRHAAEESIHTDSDFESEEPATEEPSTTATSTHPHEVEEHSLTDHESPNTEEITEAFKRAVQSGNDALVMQLMDEYPSLELLDVPFEAGDNALHVAVKNTAHSLILFLLNHGLSVSCFIQLHNNSIHIFPNKQNTENGETALHAAVRTHDVRMVALLSKYKADPLITDYNQQTPLQVAQDNHDEDIIELLSPDTQQLVSMLSPTAAAAATQPDETIVDEPLVLQNEPNEPVESVASTVALKPESAAPDHEPKKKKFGSMKRMGTQAALDGLADISKKKQSLPVLEAWLEKKQDRIPYKWQKRWVIVRESHLLWSEVQRTIKDPKNVNERKKFNNSISLMSIKDIEPVTSSKSQRKFIIRLERDGSKKQSKEYLWKCASQSDRDYWVQGLRAHIKNINSISPCVSDFVTHLNTVQTVSGINKDVDAKSLEKRLVFVSLIGLFQTYKQTPMVLLYPSIFILPLKSKWIDHPKRFMDEITNSVIGQSSIFHYDPLEFARFWRLLQWKKQQKLLFCLLDSHHDLNEKEKQSQLIAPFWLYLSREFESMKLNGLDCMFQKPTNYESLRMQFKTIQEIIYQSNPHSLLPIVAYTPNQQDTRRVSTFTPSIIDGGLWHVADDYDEDEE